MPSSRSVTRGNRWSVTNRPRALTGAAGLAAVGRYAINKFGSYNNGMPTPPRTPSKKSQPPGPKESGVLHSIYNSKTTYRSRRVPRRRIKFAKKKRSAWLNQAIKVQNPQFGLGNGLFQTTSADHAQVFGSIDFCNGPDLGNMILAQLPSGTSASSPNFKDFQLYLQRFRLEFQLINPNSAAPIMIDIYKCVPRKDIAQTEIPQFGGVNNGDALAGFLQTVAGTQVTNSTNPGYPTDAIIDPKGDPLYSAVTIGFTPFMNTRFVRTFKIVEVKKITLGPLQTHTMICSSRSGRNWNAERINGLQYVKGISCAYLWRVQGLSTSTADNYPAVTLSCSWQVSSTSKVMQTRTSSMALNMGV